jgi:hypothetical protein
VVGLGDSAVGCCCCCGEELCWFGAGLCVGEGDTLGALCTPLTSSAGDLALGEGDGVHILDEGEDLLLLDTDGDPCLGVGGCELPLGARSNPFHMLASISLMF